MNPSPYILPDIRLHSDFSSAEKVIGKPADWLPSDDILSLSNLAKEMRGLVVAEPGIGKTTLLGKLCDAATQSGLMSKMFSLRDQNVLSQIESFLANSTDRKALFLDGLDEVRSASLPQVLRTIEQIAATYPEHQLIISSRWVFAQKHRNSFVDFRLISVTPFTHEQVRAYLLASDLSEASIDELFGRVFSFNNRNLIIQVPRYLLYLTVFLKERGIVAASNLSRNELFEYFIYRKLSLEEEKVSTEKRAMTKRVLEKLALIMEVYQTNVISKDELMTFFDDTKSDLTAVALAQVPLEMLFDLSLLKNNPESVEFENTEFQEYLAAKEITRFSDPARAAFDFSADASARQIYPILTNMLTFLVDMLPSLLEPLIEFSGMRSGFNIVDETFWEFLSRVDTARLDDDLRRRLFCDVSDYHKRTRQWLRWGMAAGMASFFDASLEEHLKQWAADGESKTDSERYVLLGNLAYVLGHILKQRKNIDRPFWRQSAIKWATDQNENGVLQRHALYALGQMRDPSVIDDLPDLTGAEELIAREFINLCAKVAPDHPKCLGYFVNAVKMENIYGRDSVLALRAGPSITRLYDMLAADDSFRHALLRFDSISGRKDRRFWDNVVRVCDDAVCEAASNFLAIAALEDESLEWRDSQFIRSTWTAIRDHDEEALPKLLGRILHSEREPPFWTERFFARLLDEQDIPAFVRWSVQNGVRKFAASTMMHLHYIDTPEAARTYEAGRLGLEFEYAAADAERERQRASSAIPDNGRRKLDELRRRLEPEPGKYSKDVFRYFNQNQETLMSLLAQSDRDAMIALLNGTVFKYIDPSTYELRITKEESGSTTYTTADGVHIFREALAVAKRLNIDMTAFRQKIISFIPFAYHDDLELIFQLVPDVEQAEMLPVLNVYQEKKSDLWRHRPLSFINSVERYRIHGAVPILRSFARESRFDTFCRARALSVAEALSPDEECLRSAYAEFRSEGTEVGKSLAEEANRLLITAHGARDAVEWRLNEIVIRAAEFTRQTGVHGVDAFEGELYDKEFASPLMQLDSVVHEGAFLRLVDEAVDLLESGSGFTAYAHYIWDIVLAYFGNRKKQGSYAPLRILEQKIASVSEREGANWLAARIPELRRAYLDYLGKPPNIASAIAKFNQSRVRQARQIGNSEDLFTYLHDALSTDLRTWIEGEGAYTIITGEKVFKGKMQGYEKLVQRTLKAQIENILLKRGFQVELLREPELLDHKRIDFLVRYGFAGPVLIEVKLTSNSDLQGKQLETSPSFESMRRYMEGFGAAHGFLLVFVNTDAKNIREIKRTFEGLRGVSVLVFECSENKPESKRKRSARNTSEVKRTSRVPLDRSR